MKLFRFMSNKEFQLFTAGCEIKGKKAFKAKTSSTGICFLSSSEFSPEEAYLFLTGIVSDEVCVEFEIENSALTKSYAIYSNGYGELMSIQEYCINSYSLDNAKCLKYGILKSEYDNEIEWYTFNY